MRNQHQPGSRARKRLATYWLVILASAFGLNACVYSDIPLSGRQFKDRSLCGKWQRILDRTGHRMELEIVAEKDRWYKIKEKEIWPDGRERIMTDRCYPTKTPVGSFLNIEVSVPVKHGESAQKQHAETFMFVKYSVSRDELSFWNFDEEQLIVDIHAKHVAGDVDNETTPWRIVRLHDTAPRMLKYFCDRAKGTLFVPAGYFKRV